MADTGALPLLVALECAAESSEDLRTKCTRAMKAIVGKLTHLPALDAMANNPAPVPEAVMKLVLEQIGRVLANDPPSRPAFVHSGGLAAVQRMAEAPGGRLKEAVEIINSNYPEQIVKYYSPSYSQALLQELEAQSMVAAS
jgi:hypothetical protein